MNSEYNDKDIKNLNEIKSFLDENEIKYSTEYSNFCLYYDNTDGKRLYEIEYVPSMQYLIEYPNFGIKGVSKDFFFKLSYQAEIENNSFKLWIKDFEWENERQREVLKSYILHAAGKTPHKYYARDCEVREVDSKIARAFEDVNCFYGRRGASLNLGLYLKKEKGGLPEGTLLMLYTFGKNYFGKKDGNIEIIRVGTRRFSHVSGGSSKLLNHFIKNYQTIKIGDNDVKVEHIKFYSDYDHNLGNSMDSIGFKFTGYSKGGFINYWVDEKIVKHREPMKHKWVMEQMKLGKCLAIPNSGTKNFIINIDEIKENVK
jgi:hypothetical protein